MWPKEERGSVPEGTGLGSGYPGGKFSSFMLYIKDRICYI